MLSHLRRFLMAALFLVPACPAGAAYTGIVAFGDSLSDTGNVFVGTGGAIPAPPYFAGRFSNGPIWLDYLANNLGVAPVAPALLGGTNYAFGQATTGFVPTLSNPSQVPTFAQQAGMFSAAVGGVAPSSALYSVWIGGTDILNILASGVDAATAMAQAQGTANFAAGIIGNLRGIGAHDFLIPLLPDIGKAPGLIAQGPGAVLAGSTLAAAYNSALLAALAGVQASGANLFIVDTFTLVDAAVANPGAYGFTNVTDACYLGPLTGGGSGCATPDQYLFWDSEHPTSAAHALVAAAAVAAIPEPSGALVMALAVATLIRRTRKKA